MAEVLLDASVLVPLLWTPHEAHTHVQHWFARSAQNGWATCPFTQAAFVRILCNPAFSRDAVRPSEAMKLLNENLGHPAHRFWPDDVPFLQAVKPLASRIVGRQQVTDAYLLGLAIHNKGKLATMDRSLVSLLQADRQKEFVVLL